VLFLIKAGLTTSFALNGLRLYLNQRPQRLRKESIECFFSMAMDLT